MSGRSQRHLREIYGVDSAGDTDAINEPLLPITGGRVGSFGDSFITAASSVVGSSLTTFMQGVMVWAEAISLGAIQYNHTTNKGANGEKTADINVRIAAQAAGMVDDVDVWYYSGGRNDVTQGVAAATTIANIKAGCAMLTALGKPVFLDIPNPPRKNGSTSSEQRAVMNAVNAAIREWAATQVNVRLHDYFDDWDNGDGQPKTNYLYDDIHPSRVGAYWAAVRFWEDFGDLFPTRQNAPIITAYNSATNPMGNLVAVKSANAMNLAGTGGHKLNSQGSLATDWQCGRDSGTSANTDVTLSKEADEGARSKQVFALNMTGTFIGNALSLTPFGASPTTPAELLGKYIVAEFMVEVTASNKMTLPGAIIYARNNNANVTSVGLSNADSMANDGWSVPPGLYLVRTPPVLVAAVDVTPTFWSQLKLAVLAGTTAGFKVSKPTINIVA